MFTKLSIVFVTLFWMGTQMHPGVADVVDCPKYYNTELKEYVYTKVEIEPEFPGGAAAYARFVNKNLKIQFDTMDDQVTPLIPKMKFIVDTNGQIINPGIDGKNDTTQFNSFDKEVVRLIKLMPKWTPGMCQGKKVTTEVNRSFLICILWESEK